MSQALDKTATDRIGDDHKHDRDAAGQSQQRCRDRGGHSQDHVMRHCHRFSDVRADELGIGSAKADIDSDVVPLSPPKLVHPLPECCEARLRGWIVLGVTQQDADPTH